ncbi:hypothetical protein SLEP1_g12279 [Rubroshorea leprosula]|uniref:F-box domain-containing protein n=1 Tax=Rubroshorea leprosula TaxID=152421 RepID=A0AAV5IL83_9ROSI|nr:hypothetical protein SLEP1_g12279 [Rubroshorea leprosula]
MINQLPNSILGTILSFLNLREAVRTSVLSTRWRKIWTTSLSVLNFGADNMLGKIQYSDTDHSFGPYGWRVHRGDRLSFLRKRRQAFVDSVN